MATTHNLPSRFQRTESEQSLKYHPTWRCVLRDRPQELPWHDRQASDLSAPILVRVQERNVFVMELC